MYDVQNHRATSKPHTKPWWTSLAPEVRGNADSEKIEWHVKFEGKNFGLIRTQRKPPSPTEFCSWDILGHDDVVVELMHTALDGRASFVAYWVRIEVSITPQKRPRTPAVAIRKNREGAKSCSFKAVSIS